MPVAFLRARPGRLSAAGACPPRPSGLACGRRVRPPRPLRAPARRPCLGRRRRLACGGGPRRPAPAAVSSRSSRSTTRRVERRGFFSDAVAASVDSDGSGAAAGASASALGAAASPASSARRRGRHLGGAALASRALPAAGFSAPALPRRRWPLQPAGSSACRPPARNRLAPGVLVFGKLDRHRAAVLRDTARRELVEQLLDAGSFRSCARRSPGSASEGGCPPRRAPSTCRCCGCR